MDNTYIFKQKKVSHIVVLLWCCVCWLRVSAVPFRRSHQLRLQVDLRPSVI
jgi:hypothetical protein